VSGKTDSSEVLGLSVEQFIEATAAKQPTPGGGSVAGLVGSLAAALGQMTLNYTRGKKKFSRHEQCHVRAAKRLRRAGQMFKDLLSDDIQAYQLYVEAAGMSDGPDKQQAVELALAAAIDVPREVAKLALAVLADLSDLTDKCNPQLISDLKAAAALAAAAARLSHYNVQINAARLADRQAAGEVLAGSESDLDRAEQILRSIENG